jgi:acetylglutamate kinase
MAYVTDGKIGIDLTATPANANPGEVLGVKVSTEDAGTFMYVHASGAITQYDAVGIDENYEAAALTKAIADDGHMIGFAQVAFDDNDYGWVCVNGSNINVRVAASCAADVSLYTTSTAGVLDDTSASQTKIQGITAVAANATASGTNTEVIAISPHVELPA